MVSFKQGNLLDARVEAVVNTVNTVGVMGKGIALMFKERFPENFSAYVRACKSGHIRPGRMFVTEDANLFGRQCVINFPTKQHWRGRTRVEWIEDGLQDLVRIIKEKQIRSIAIPPLGCGNGGLDWKDVRPLITRALDGIDGIDVLIYEPTEQYQNVGERKGVGRLTPARALVVEMTRRYCLLGECSILEVQKLAWFIERGVKRFRMDDPLRLNFSANRYGPYSHNLQKLLDSLDGSYLRCDKRLADVEPFDVIWFNHDKSGVLRDYLLAGDGRTYNRVIEWAAFAIDGFESPLDMELLSTVDWLVEEQDVSPKVSEVMKGLARWSGGAAAGLRKLKIFDARIIEIALNHLHSANNLPA